MSELGLTLAAFATVWPIVVVIWLYHWWRARRNEPTSDEILRRLAQYESRFYGLTEEDFIECERQGTHPLRQETRDGCGPEYGPTQVFEWEETLTSEVRSLTFKLWHKLVEVKDSHFKVRNPRNGGTRPA